MDMIYKWKSLKTVATGCYVMKIGTTLKNLANLDVELFGKLEMLLIANIFGRQMLWAKTNWLKNLNEFDTIEFNFLHPIDCN